MALPGAVRLGLALTLLVAALSLRLAELDRLVTPDEPLWITRSARFDDALAAGRLEDTFQAVHPGVTLMWAGTAVYELVDPAVPAKVPGPEILPRQVFVHEVLEPLGVDVLDLLVDLRLGAIVLNALVLVAAVWLLWQAVGAWPALVAAALIAFEPLHVGTSRLLHLDALAAGLLLVSALALLRFHQTTSRRYLAGAAVAAALTWLTRTSGLYLGLWTIGVLAVPVLRAWREGRSAALPAIRSAVVAGAIWGGVALATTVVCWPALWVAPLATLDETVRGSFSLASEAHQKQIFFRGKVWEEDPGWFFYPVSFAWRTTPSVLIGLGLVAVAALPRGGRLDRRSRYAAGYLALFGLGYLLLLGFGEKKIDRYVLPVMVVADVLAAIGWVWLATRLLARARDGLSEPALRAGAAALLAAAVTVQAGLAVVAAPYYFQYYNPLFGGLDGARDVMMIGWGEGYDQAGAWLDAQPDAAGLRVTAGPWPATLDYYFVGAVSQRDHMLDPSGQIREWLTTDVAVVSFAEIQRALVGAAFWQALQELPPAKVVRIDGQAMIWVYDLRGRPVPDIVYASSPVAFAWPSGLRLLDVTTRNRDFSAGTSIGVNLWLQDPPTAGDAQMLRAAILHPETGERYAVEIEVPRTVDGRGVAVAAGRIKTPVDASAGVYQLCVAAFAESGAVIQGSGPSTGAPAPEVCGGSVELLPPGVEGGPPPE